jgi:hypothetical protein
VFAMLFQRRMTSAGEGSLATGEVFEVAPAYDGPALLGSDQDVEPVVLQFDKL